MGRAGFDPARRESRSADAQRRALDALGGMLPSTPNGEPPEPAGTAAAAEPSEPRDTEWVSVADAAEAAGVSTSTIRYWYRHGSIPTQRADGAGGRYLVPLDAVLARASRLGEDELEDDELDMDAVYWSAECERARKEADGLRSQLESARSRIAELEGLVHELETELDSLEIIEEDDLEVAAAAPIEHDRHQDEDRDHRDQEQDQEQDQDVFEPAPFVADIPGPSQGYRGPLRPQDPRRELVFEDEAGRTGGPTLALPAVSGEEQAGIELDGPDEFVAGRQDPEIPFAAQPEFEDDVLPAPEKKRRR